MGFFRTSPLQLHSITFEICLSVTICLARMLLPERITEVLPKPNRRSLVAQSQSNCNVDGEGEAASSAKWDRPYLPVST